MSKIKKQCEQYLGNRGVDQAIKRCAKYENMWFILFKEYPKEVEISFSNNFCYECYTEISVDNMKWNKSFYKTIEEKINNERKKVA